MTTPRGLQARAQRKLARIERARRDPRFERVLGRLRAAGVLLTNFEVREHRNPIRIADALFAGQLEPRVLELLPALVIKTPSLFDDVRELPPDLARAVRALQRGETPEDFRGIPGADVRKWLPRVGRKQLPTRLKAFRFRSDDLDLLRRLSQKLGLTETDVVRHALRGLAASELLEARREPRS